MNIKRCRKEEFTVIGKQGNTNEGEDFVNALWKKANEGMNEIASLVKCDGRGMPVGFWGIRSSFTTPFAEWENGEGLYMAGLEAKDGSFAPMGWTKWVIPESVYVSVQVEGTIEAAVSEVKKYCEKNHLIITGAYHEYMNVFLPGQLILFFPVKEKSVFILSEEGKAE
jgi:predicted transcriptional regulator YdeE